MALRPSSRRLQRPSPASSDVVVPAASVGSSVGPRAEEPITVSELVGLITESLKSGFPRVAVAGELSSFTRNRASGHCYLTLSDDSAAINCVMWRSQAERLGFDPRVGDEVVCRGHVGVYDKQGRMQLYLSSMRPLGVGEAQRALEELKRRLATEGLFDDERKRRLPLLPATIGLVTSADGAALADMLSTIHRRLGRCRVVLSPALVQGAEAPASLVEALDMLAEWGGADVAVVGRGGGSAEDLAAFNDESVVRAIAAFPVPIVSAVGHEVDFTLSDLAADVRAATPTAAAEAVAPVAAELEDLIATMSLRLRPAVLRLVDGLRHRLGNTAGRLRDPEALLARARQRVDEVFNALFRALAFRHRRAAEHFAELRSKLDALSPLAVLSRGYSLVSTDDGLLVRSASELSVGDRLVLRFNRGRARVDVSDLDIEGEE